MPRARWNNNAYYSEQITITITITNTIAILFLETDFPKKREAFTQSWFNAGPVSQTVCQNWNKIG